MTNSNNGASPLPRPDIKLPITDGSFLRPPKEIIEALYKVSSATATSNLHKLGLRQTYVHGPVTRAPGQKVVGPTLTLQFMPQREDIASGVQQEYSERESALWHVFDATQPGDILSVQAWGDPYTGCLGEMLITYFEGKGGVGIVVDGYIRDWPKVEQIGTPIWCRGCTPHYASQGDLYPWAYNVPIALARVLVLPGDIIIADDDGVVAVPAKLATRLLEVSLHHEDWEEFSRMRLAEGGSIWDYYPLSEKGQKEFEEWRSSSTPLARS